jgi:hypothetical protein
MSESKRLTPERIAEIKAFKDEDISDCPELTEEELKKMRPPAAHYLQCTKKPGTAAKRSPVTAFTPR